MVLGKKSTLKTYLEIVYEKAFCLMKYKYSPQSIASEIQFGFSMTHDLHVGHLNSNCKDWANSCERTGE